MGWQASSFSSKVSRGDREAIGDRWGSKDGRFVCEFVKEMKFVAKKKQKRRGKMMAEHRSKVAVYA